MFATIRESYGRPGTDGAEPELRDFRALRAKQPGYRGAVTVNVGEGRVVILALWDTEAQAIAARDVLTPVAQRMVGTVLAEPTRLLGMGTVLHDDMTHA